MREVDVIKRQLMDQCMALVEQRIGNSRQAMNAAQESANAEEKSSAGDKYETGRAMAQIERDKAAQQLKEAMHLKSVLQTINLKSSAGVVTQGSLVITDVNHFFIAISLGKQTVANADYFVIAPATPIGRLLMGLHVGSQFSFNNQMHTIREIL
jgi:transcription elongation GreA/GreB family factor